MYVLKMKRIWWIKFVVITVLTVLTLVYCTMSNSLSHQGSNFMHTAVYNFEEYLEKDIAYCEKSAGFEGIHMLRITYNKPLLMACYEDLEPIAIEIFYHADGHERCWQRNFIEDRCLDAAKEFPYSMPLTPFNLPISSIGRFDSAFAMFQIYAESCQVNPGNSVEIIQKNDMLVYMFGDENSNICLSGTTDIDP